MVFVQKVMPVPVFFIGNHGIQVYVFHTPENIFCHIGIFLFQFMNQGFYLSPFGTLIRFFPCALFGKPAGAPYKTKLIISRPVNDIVLPDQIKRTDQQVLLQ